MASDDPSPPVADDDFPEFAEPPRHRPPVDEAPEEPSSHRAGSEAQAQADDLIARLRREREEGKR